MGRTAGLPRAEDQIHNGVHALAMLDLSKDGRTTLAHLPRVALHDAQVRTHNLGQVRLVDDQQVALGNTRPSLSRNLVAATDIDDIDDKVGQLAAVVCREVVAAGLDQQQLRAELVVQVRQRGQVGANVLAHSGVRAAARLDGADPLRRQCRVAL